MSEKLTTVRLSGQLGTRFGKIHKFYIASPAEAVRALCSQIEGFSTYLNDTGRRTLYRVFVADTQINPDEELHDLSNGKEIRIGPVIQGAKNSGLFSVVLGAALVALAFTPLGALTLPTLLGGGTFGSILFSMGASMILGGLAQLLSPQPKLNIQEAPNNTPNTSLGVVNTSAQGRPVPIVVGECMVGSTVISAGIFASDTNR